MGFDDNDGATWAALQALEVALRPFPLSERELAIRHQFAREYMHDRDITAAAMRCGFGISFATDYGRKFFDEPLVQQLIKELEEQEPDDPVELQKVRFKRVERALLRDMNLVEFNSGSQSARVSAARTLAQIYGLEAPKQHEHKVQGKVLVVPAIASIEDWKATAIPSQAKLMEDAARDAE